MTKKLLAAYLLVMLTGYANAQEDWNSVRGSDTLWEIETTIKSITVRSDSLIPRYEVQIDNSTVRAGDCPDSDAVYILDDDLELLDSVKLAQALELPVRVVVDDSKDQVLSESAGSFRCALVSITVLSESE